MTWRWAAVAAAASVASGNVPRPLVEVSDTSALGLQKPPEATIAGVEPATR